jgi:hypothetical protein
MLRTVAKAGLATLVFSLGYMPGGAIASPLSTTVSRPTASQPTTSQPADPGEVDGDIGVAHLAVRLLREGFQAGQVRADDVRMGILPDLVQEMIPSRIRVRITGRAARDAALARASEVSDLLDITIMPAMKKAAESRDPNDVRTLLPLLDRFEKQLVDLETTLPDPEDVQIRQALLDADAMMRQTLRKATNLAATGQCAERMTEVLKAMAIYITTHKGRFPATLGDIYQDMVSRSDVSPAKAAEAFLCPNDMKKLTIPAQVTPEWINRNTSYVYLGSAALTDDADPGAIILHEKIDAGHGKHVNVGYVDTHVMSMVKSVEMEIAESRRLLAPRTDGHP